MEAIKIPQGEKLKFSEYQKAINDLYNTMAVISFFGQIFENNIKIDSDTSIGMSILCDWTYEHAINAIGNMPHSWQGLEAMMQEGENA